MSQKNSVLEELANGELNSVDYLMSTASNFSQESKTMTFVDDIRAQFGTFVGRAAGFFTASKIGNFKPVTVIPGKLLELADGPGYQQLAPKVISIPLGFKGKYIDYIQCLEKTAGVVEGLEKTLSIAATNLAVLAHEPDRMKAQANLRNLESNLNTLSAEDFGQLRGFVGQHGKAQGRLSDVVDRGGDLAEIYKRVNQLNTRCSRIDFRAIDAKTARLAELIKAVKQELDAAGEGGVSGGTASALSTMIYGLGTTVSAAAMLAANVADLTHCLQANVAELVI